MPSPTGWFRIGENLNRILPDGLNARIDLGKIRILPIFKTLKKFGALEDSDMLRTFNMGVGMTAVVRKEFADEAVAHLKQFDVVAYPVGAIKAGKKEVEFSGALQWE